MLSSAFMALQMDKIKEKYMKIESLEHLEDRDKSLVYQKVANLIYEAKNKELSQEKIFKYMNELPKHLQKDFLNALGEYLQK